MRGRRVLLQGPGNALKVLLGSGQQATLQNVGDIALGVQFGFRGHKKQRKPSVSVTAVQTMRDCRFWHLVTILPSVDYEVPQTRSFC